MSWYAQSGADGDTHRAASLSRGRVNAVCGINFAPVRAGRSRALASEQVQAGQRCPDCMQASQ